MPAKSNRNKAPFSGCIIRANGLILTSEQHERREYYEEIFINVLNLVRKTDDAALDLTELEEKSKEIYVLNASANLRRKLRKTFGSNVTERVIQGKGNSGLCKLHGFS